MESKNATANSSPNSSALQACLREAIAEGPNLIKRWINGLSEELNIKESGASSFKQRTDFINSQNQLSKLRQEIEKQWIHQWEQAVQDGLKGQHSQTSTRRSLSQIKFEELELMGDDQIQATVEIARIQQSVQVIADQALTDLSARMSRAQGLAVVRSSQNPLRPEIVVQALTQTLDTVCSDKSARSLWLQHGSKAMGQELAVFYRHLCHLLDQYGVTPAQYGPVQAPGGNPSAGHSINHTNSADAYQNPAPQNWGAKGGDAWGNTGHGMLSNGYGMVQHAQPVAPSLPSGDFRPSSLLTLNHLHQLLVSENAQALFQTHGASQKEYGQQGFLSQEVEDHVPLPPLMLADEAASQATILDPIEEDSQITRYQGPERRKRPRGGQLSEAKTLGKRSLQDLAEEVVGLMLDGIAQDDRLLSPVSTTLRRLRPALLQVAHQEPRFFADRGNPARRLLDEMTQRSLAFTSTDSNGFDLFVKKLEDVVSALSDQELNTQNIALSFEKALCILDESPETVPQTLEDNEAEQDKAVASLLKAEQRYLVAEKIAQKIQTRKDFSVASAEIQQFLTGPWAQVIALAQMHPSPDDKQTGGKTADQRYTDAVSDLLWSCHLELASRNRARLARVIPGLLRQLREGLHRIEYPVEQSAPFFDALMRHHEAALRTTTVQQEIDTPQSSKQAMTIPESARTTEDADTIPDADPGPWLSPSEVKDASLLEVVPADGSDFEATEPARLEGSSPNWSADTVPAELLAHDDTLDLHVGAWIEIEQIAGDRQRARLKWSSPHGNMYLFIRTDGKSISMTKRMYQALVSQQRVRLVADQSVVDDALDEVMAAAVRNSTNNN